MDIVVDKRGRVVTKAGREVALTPKGIRDFCLAVRKYWPRVYPRIPAGCRLGVLLCGRYAHGGRAHPQAAAKAELDNETLKTVFGVGYRLSQTGSRGGDAHHQGQICTIGFILIFGSLLLLLNVVVGIFLRNNNDSVDSERNGVVYEPQQCVRPADVSGQRKEQRAGRRLPRSRRDRTGSCDVTGEGAATTIFDGVLIQASSTAAFEGADYEGYENALSDKLSFTIVQEGNKVQAYFAFPVMVAGKRWAFCAFCKPYQDLYAQSTRTGNFILFASLIVFTVAFIFAYILSASISRPIVTLTRATNQVARGRATREYSATTRSAA